MANTVVKVTDAMLNDSLLLLVGEDGTVTPDRDTVDKYLNSKSEPTNIQLMQINKLGKGSIDISVEDLTYVPDEVTEDIEIVSKSHDMDNVARILYSFKLDHDYTSFDLPCAEKTQEIEELVQALEESAEGTTEKKLKEKFVPKRNSEIAAAKKSKGGVVKDDVSSLEQKSLKQKLKTSPVKVTNASKLSKEKPHIVQLIEQEFDEESEEENYEFEDDKNDLDFEIEEDNLQKKKKTHKKIKQIVSSKVISKREILPKSVKTETAANLLEKSNTEIEKSSSKEKDEKLLENLDQKLNDKKQKKEKKIPKPIPNDFMLFATPDIIRRVGGKDASQETSMESFSPAKINSENRSKSVSEKKDISPKANRLSLDSKPSSEKKEKVDDLEKKVNARHSEKKDRERRSSTGSSSLKSKHNLEDKLNLSESSKALKKLSEKSFAHSKSETLSSSNRSDNSFSMSPLVLQTSEVSSTESCLDQNIPIDTSALDLDQSILDNINSDEISEDILYQVAQSLVGNPVLQTAIDKGINEGNLVLDPSLQPSLQGNNPSGSSIEPSPVQNETEVLQKAQQIVRPDGRIVVIPPVERPATRSRNRKKETGPISNKLPILKPLDNEHVAGDELDSSENEPEEEEEEEEDDDEESEDDPNKLWCICNQPHNNRFMICCDTCEEWYHGKCVNITKAMGQQMEEEGKEWICLFCKNPNLKRPEAAARRIRKASRASTDSAESGNKSKQSTQAKVSCIVCQKPARKNSIYCSESCILTHAQGVEKVIVYEKSSGNMLMGAKAPSSTNLESWLKEHPSYQVYRSGGKIVTSKSQANKQNLTQSKLKIVKNKEDHGVSLAVQSKGLKIGTLKHSPKTITTKTTSLVSTEKPSPQQKMIKLISPKPQIVKVIGRQSTENQATSPKVQKVQANMPTTPKIPKLVQTSLKTSASKEKTVGTKTVKVVKAEQQSPAATKTPKPQENIRENVQKTLYEQLLNRLKLDNTLKVSDEEVKNMSLEIESQLYKCFGDTGQKYRNKYRSLIFNIKDIKNQTLWKRICEKSVSAYQLVRLSPDDLASQELAMWREKEAKHQLDMIKKSELELLNCSRQYVLKTHKGEQVLEDDRPTDDLDDNEVIRTLTEGNQTEKDSRSDGPKDMKKSSKRSHRSKDRHSSKDHHSRHHRSASRDRKSSKDRSSSSRKDKRKSRSKDRHRKSSHKTTRHKRENIIASTEKLDKKSKEILEQLVDNKIVPPLEDRLWKHVPQDDVVSAPSVESDSDHEPSSTVTIPSPPHTVESNETQGSQLIDKAAKDKEMEPVKSMSPPPKTQSPSEIWKGTINMIDVAQISITAHEVSGDCTGLGVALPPNLDIVGRISPDTVWDYIGKMKCSNSKSISLVRLNATNIEEKMPYLALYSYLSSRKRLGVVKSVNKAIKDFYILPLAPQKPIPQALLPLNGPGFEESRPALLLGIIVRDKRKRTLVDLSLTSNLISKKSKTIDTPVNNSELKDSSLSAYPPRSYTPPTVSKEAEIKQSVSSPEKDDDGDEPYSPEDSDPDVSMITPKQTTSSVLPFLEAVSDVPEIPYTIGTAEKYTPLSSNLSENIVPPSSLDLQRQMEEINKKIEMQKSEINSISKNIVSASTDIGSSALASISLPSNLQQILDSIKTISNETPEQTAAVPNQNLTIPLILPKSFPRPPPALPTPLLSTPTLASSFSPPAINTIPLNLPIKNKSKVPLTNVSSNAESPSVLSSLSEEELVKKAAEMLGESLQPSLKSKGGSQSGSSKHHFPAKRAKYESSEPPIPGVDD